ncbi:MAG: gliding motility-associated C-terminal domain-containing protein, partial [Bacteroidales bacterium]
VAEVDQSGFFQSYIFRDTLVDSLSQGSSLSLSLSDKDEVLLFAQGDSALTEVSFAGVLHPDSILFAGVNVFGSLQSYLLRDTLVDSTFHSSQIVFAGGDKPRFYRDLDSIFTALSIADFRHPDSILVADAEISGFLQSYIFRDTLVDSLSQGSSLSLSLSDKDEVLLFAQGDSALTEVSFAGVLHPDSIFLIGVELSGALQSYAAIDTLRSYIYMGFHEPKLEYFTLKGDTMYERGVDDCRNIEFPDLKFDTLAFKGDREVNFNLIYNDTLIRFCASTDTTLILAVAPSVPVVIRWHDKRDPNRVLGLGDTLILRHPIQEGDYVAYAVFNDTSPILFDSSFIVTVQSLENLYEIDRLPDSAVLCYGDSITLTYRVGEVARYSWYKDSAGQRIHIVTYDSVSEDILHTHTIVALDSAGVHRYILAAENDCDTIYDTIYLKVLRSPVINSLAPLLMACRDKELDFGAKITYADTVAWYFKGELIANTVDLKKVITVNDIGVYMVVVSATVDPSEEIRCPTDTGYVEVDIYGPLEIWVDVPDTIGVCRDDSVEITYVVDHDSKADRYTLYTWYKESISQETKIESYRGPQDSTFMIYGTDLVGTYTRYIVVAQNACETIIDTIYVGVTLKPEFSSQQILVVGEVREYEKFQLVTTVRDNFMLSYEWRLNDQPLVNDGVAVSGADRDTLTIMPFQSYKHAGDYTVKIYNACDTIESLIKRITPVDTQFWDINVTKVAVDKYDTPVDRVTTDSTIYFKIRVENVGLANAYKLTLTDTMPDGFEYIGDPSLLISEGILKFELKDALLIDSVVEFVYPVKTINSGVYVNTVHISDYKDNYRTAIAVVTIYSQKDLQILKNVVNVVNTLGEPKGFAGAVKDSIIVGDVITYRVTVNNLSVIANSVLREVNVVDIWPTRGAEYVSHNFFGLNANIDIGAGRVDVAVGDMLAGTSIYFEVSVKMIEEGRHRFSAHATTPEEEADTINNKVEMSAYVMQHILPTVITPNGDGINDRFEVLLGLSFPNNEFYVYNRLGNTVFYRKGYYDQFDGTGLAEGSYIYVFNYIDDRGKLRRMSGTIFVTRK